MTEQVALDLEPIQTIPAYRSAADSISQRILSGEWAIGSGLPSETALAQMLGVNRSTMREAIRVLEENGMLRRRRGGKQLFVSAPRDAEIAMRIKAAMVLQEMSFLELWEAMICIEPAVAAAAALRVTDSELALLEDNLDRMRLAAGNSEELARLDFEFHVIIADAARSLYAALVPRTDWAIILPRAAAARAAPQRGGATHFRPRADTRRLAQ